MIRFLPCFIKEGLEQWGRGESGLGAGFGCCCNTTQELLLPCKVFCCDILLFLRAESGRRPMPTCNVV